MSIQARIDRELKRLAPLAPQGYYIGLHIRFTTPVLSFKTYDQGWLDHYSENGYVLRDPMIAWGFSTTGWIRWSDAGLPDPFGLFKEAAGFGLRHGLTIACGPIKSRTIASFGRSDREYADEEADLITACVYRMHDLIPPPEKLTKAQVDGLRCIANGMRHAQAAQNLQISESALKARITAARTRLMARTTAEAVQRAKESGLI